MANGKDNLVSLADRTTEERREIARAGGIASGEARRRKRSWRECAEIIGEWDIAMPLPGGVTKEMTYIMAAILKQYQKAIMEGDTNAVKFLAKLLGEIVDKHEVEAKGTVVFLPKDEIEGLKELAQ